MNQQSKILLIEDNDALGYLLTEYLRMKDFSIRWAKNGIEGLQVIKEEEFDLIILDVMMPEMDGFTLAKNIKQQFPKTPFIFLTARSLKIDVLKGFSLGAIDYLKKPIDEEELVVRIHTLLQTLSLKQNSKKINPSNFIIGGYLFDSKNSQLIFNNDSFKLTIRENNVLRFLILNENQICTHKDILNTIWGKNDYFNKKSLNVFISRLRKYLSKDHRIKIENIHNQGFILKIEQ